MKISEKLTKRLEDLFKVKIVSCERLRPGYWQKDAGAWLWEASSDSGIRYGSINTMKGCVDCSDSDFTMWLESDPPHHLQG